jgi:hypothetical protein
MTFRHTPLEGLGVEAETASRRGRQVLWPETQKLYHRYTVKDNRSAWMHPRQVSSRLVDAAAKDQQRDSGYVIRRMP